MCWPATSIICRSVEKQAPSDPRRGGDWYAQPVVWLGIAVFIASLAGCIWLIVVGARYDDAAISASNRVFGVPTRQTSPPVNRADPPQGRGRSSSRTPF